MAAMHQVFQSGLHGLKFPQLLVQLLDMRLSESPDLSARALAVLKAPL
jgi:hypothetical protein